MKASLCVFLAALVLAGCGKSESKPAPTANPSSAGADNNPGGYLGALANGQKLAVKTVDVASLTQAIQMFNAQEGRFPKDLNELVTSQFIGAVPAAPYGMKLVYDPAAGTVNVVPQ